MAGVRFVCGRASCNRGCDSDSGVGGGGEDSEADSWFWDSSLIRTFYFPSFVTLGRWISLECSSIEMAGVAARSGQQGENFSLHGASDAGFALPDVHIHFGAHAELGQ